eukprot:CAMPEP_0206050242 /NCGR_PEP_ID=MMETSP1466-20131121/28735_1 /ASSEMBLY_ACC=CAM_ASM_001126 /TAXON_ID=44452 /ORGANISM="Pavlova gyrans, Strain CCMP608" /LENGTH=211 /DNA_ID=CAMNT_0053425353 /DNA_START=404 /DNA_END=1037 /DNA_ORIENTATION=+
MHAARKNVRIMLGSHHTAPNSLRAAAVVVAAAVATLEMRSLLAWVMMVAAAAAVGTGAASAVEVVPGSGARASYLAQAGPGGARLNYPAALDGQACREHGLAVLVLNVEDHVIRLDINILPHELDDAVTDFNQCLFVQGSPVRGEHEIQARYSEILVGGFVAGSQHLVEEVEDAHRRLAAGSTGRKSADDLVTVDRGAKVACRIKPCAPYP